LFDLAYDHSKSKDRKDTVTRSRAEFYFKEGRFDKSALYFAHCGMNFEEVVLRLLGINENLSILQRNVSSFSSFVTDNAPFPSSVGKNEAGSDSKLLWMSNSVNLNPVRVYLLELLKILPSSSKSQRTLLCTWLSEIFLHQITSYEISLTPVVGTDLTNDFMTFMKVNRFVVSSFLLVVFVFSSLGLCSSWLSFCISAFDLFVIFLEILLILQRFSI
jgi:hypothetical protein